MNDFLHKAIKERYADARAAARKISIASLEQQVAERTKRRSLKKKFMPASGINNLALIIAEVKKASPSAGMIREQYRPAEIAVEYEKCGAIGISVLTEPRYFFGADDDLRAVRCAVDLPILRKDFICDSYQIYESAAMGADVVLLIFSALDESVLKRLYDTAISIGLEVLVETHTSEELDRALQLSEAIVGVNSRNLKTLKTDLEVARTLASKIPRNRICIAESGIKTRENIEELLDLGYSGFLIGETLMKSGNLAAVFQSLRG